MKARVEMDFFIVASTCGLKISFLSMRTPRYFYTMNLLKVVTIVSISTNDEIYFVCYENDLTLEWVKFQ